MIRLQIHLFLLLALLFSINSNAQTTILLQVPQNTPPSDQIFIAGDFQGWNPGDANYALAKDASLGRYHITLAANLGNIQFKFTRGTWPTVETDADGNFVPNRTHNTSNSDSIYLQVLGWEDLNGNGGGQSTAAENVSIMTDSFYIPQFDRYRRVWLYLPPDYATTTKNYPVLYMHDGQNVFDALTAFSGEWEVDETLNALFADGDPGIIVVAVDNGGTARIDEYTPWPHPSYGGGAGANYVNFLVEELKPYIDNNYRTLPGRENTGIMGSSLGGLISTFAGIEHQDVFGKVGSFSPSYWFSDSAFDHVTATGKVAPMRIYQIAGTLEGSSTVDDLFAMDNTLHSVGFGEEEAVAYEFADGQHSEWFWAREFEAAYLWLFRNTTVAVEEVAPTKQAYRLYPNPVSDTLNLEFSLEKSTNIQIKAIDTLGRKTWLVFSGKRPSGLQTMAFDLGKMGLAAGRYFLEVNTDSGVVALPFVVD